jgi:magnesium-transporting ATPase (P-type)
VVSAGTVVVRGRGRAVVTATGAASAMGQIATPLDTTTAVLTPLQRRLVGLGRVLAGVAVGLCAVVLALGLLRGQPLELMVVTAISLVVAAVPESLPAVVTLSLALGARRMAARHAIIRRLPAVETLGSVTGRPWQSMVVLALGVTQLGVALGVRARAGTAANPFLLVAVAAAFTLQIAGLYLPPLRDLLGTQPLPLTDLVIVCVTAVLGYLAVRLDLRLGRGHQHAVRDTT